MPRGGIDPLPTTFRHVSGKSAVKRTRKEALKMARNQNMERQPRN